MHIVITISFWIVLYKRSVQFINQIQFVKHKSFEMGEKFTILFYFQIEIHPEKEENVKQRDGGGDREFYF